MLSKTCYLAILSLLIACFGGHVASARTVDYIIAYVNDDVITKWELDNVVRQRAMELQQSYQFSEREAMRKAEEERSDLLDRLIRQKLLIETALTLKIEVTDAEVEQYVQNFKKQYQIDTEEEFMEELKKEGYTPVDFREQAKRSLMAERLLMQRILPRIQVWDKDVQKFFEENRSQFSTKADNIHLRHIFLAFKPSEADRQRALQKIDSIAREIEAGKDFEELAQREVTDESKKAQVGTLIELSIDEMDKLPETFRTALSTLNPGEISEPVEGNDGFYLFTVEHKADQQLGFRYLVVPLEPGEKAIQDAFERADFILKKLESGEDFNTLAQQYSDDTETKAKGGDLGVRSLSELNPETRQIIEKLSAGEHSTPLKTKYGLHIFKIDSRTSPELNEAEKNQIRSMMREKKFQEEWQTYTDMLMENSFVQIKPLASIGK